MNRDFSALSRTPVRVFSPRVARFAALFIVSLFAISAFAQSKTYTSISGTVVDPSGAVVPGATVEIRNPVSQFERSVSTDNSGAFSISNIPFNPYHMTVTGSGFATYVQDIDLRSPVPVSLKISLQVGTRSEERRVGKED